MPRVKYPESFSPLSSLEDATHGTTVVPTVLHSGNTTNTVPDKATLDIDARSFLKQSWSELIPQSEHYNHIIQKQKSSSMVD
ncbi:MAG: peptidase dimerization domain-containing protein [Actinomycetota bacterium]